MKLKIVFIDCKDVIYINNHEDIERINALIGGIYRRQDNWIRIEGFYINLDNIAYMEIMEDN